MGPMTDATGRRPAEDQSAVAGQDEIDTLGELTDTDIYEGELEAGVHDDLPGESVERNLEDLAAIELRSEETANPDVAAEEGRPWVPPIDPPVVPGEGSEGPQVASGFGSSALADPYDEDHHSEQLSAEGELNDLVREALRADSTTSTLEDRIAIGAIGGRIVLRGIVPDIEDSENVVAVAERVDGVIEVVDELEIETLQR
jgi:hypothetical protein